MTEKPAPVERRRTTWPAAVELQQAADNRRAAGDPLLADWLDETANALSWLAPYRDNEPGYGMWETAAAVARKILGTTEPETDAADAQPVRGELWSLLDWTFWGSGMGDVFREPLADTMLAAISPEQRKQAEQLMEAWHASGRQPLGRRRYEEQAAELKAAQQAQRAVMRIVDEYVIESNDVGGIDANDLVDRLAAAGFPLPEDQPAETEAQR